MPLHPAEIALALKASNAEAVLHFAAHALVGESMQDPGKYFRNNVASGLNLLDACVAAGVRKIVFSSTCATYGTPDRNPIDESLPQDPINPYGESKLLFERMLRWFQSIHGLEFVAFRYFNAAGATHALRRTSPHRNPSHPQHPPRRPRPVQTGPDLGTDYPTPDGTCIRDYVHVVDLADAHIRALQPGISGYFNLGAARVIPSARSSMRAAASPAKPSPRWKNPDGRAILHASSPVRPRHVRSWDGPRNSPTSNRSSPPPGIGTGATRRVTPIDRSRRNAGP
jgi:UDP-glucose 4-epimerase